MICRPAGGFCQAVSPAGWVPPGAAVAALAVSLTFCAARPTLCSEFDGTTSLAAFLSTPHDAAKGNNDSATTRRRMAVAPQKVERPHLVDPRRVDLIPWLRATRPRRTGKRRREGIHK